MKVALTARDGTFLAHTLVDDEDWLWLEECRRYLMTVGYVGVWRRGFANVKLLHRMVMARHLGRELSSKELVHHDNTQPLDNRVRNLVLTTRAEHPTHHRLPGNRVGRWENRWYATTREGQPLGGFDTEDEARFATRRGPRKVRSDKGLPGAPRPNHRGVLSGSAKLTEDDVRAIRQRSGAESQRALAREFGVSQGAVWRVVHGRTWAHVEAR